METEWLSSDRFVDTDIDFFVCIICSNIATNPQMCSLCQHIYCNSCITTWLFTNKYCPYKCNDKVDMELQKLPKSVKNLYYGLNVKCSVEGCGALVPLKELFKHENSCGSVKCQNTTHCNNDAPLLMLDKRTCSEKCYIYTKMKEGYKIDDELLFNLLNNFTDSISSNAGMIRTFNSFWLDFNNRKIVDLVAVQSQEAIAMSQKKNKHHARCENVAVEVDRQVIQIQEENKNDQSVQEAKQHTGAASLLLRRGLEILSTTNTVKNISTEPCYRTAVSPYVSFKFCLHLELNLMSLGYYGRRYLFRDKYS